MKEYLKKLEEWGHQVSVTYSPLKRTWTIAIHSKNGMERFHAEDPSMDKVFDMAMDSTHFAYIPQEIRNQNT